MPLKKEAERLQINVNENGNASDFWKIEFLDNEEYAKKNKRVVYIKQRKI